jgi:hypothetical protein
MDQVREVLRASRDAYHTEPTYSHWILRDIRHFGGTTNLTRFGTEDAERFLARLAPEGQVSASTQRRPRTPWCFSTRMSCTSPL